MKSKIVLFLIIVLGLAVRWYRIDNPVGDWHSWRQADTASVSWRYFQNGIDLLHPTYHDLSSIPAGRENPQGHRMVEFPIYNALHAGLAHISPWNFDKTGRALSVGLSLVSLVFLYLIVKKLSGVTTGLLAAFFFAVLPFNVYYSRVILPEPLMITTTLISIYFALDFFDRPKKITYLFSAIFLALALLVKPYAIFFTLPLLYFAWTKWQWKLLKSPYFYLYLALITIPLIAWRRWILQYPEGIPASGWLYNFSGIRFRPAWFRWLFGERLASLILGLWGLPLLILGLLLKPTRKENWFYHLWFLGVLIYFSIFAGGNITHDYYQAIITPIIIALLAKGGHSLLTPNRLFVWPLSIFVFLITTALMLALSWYQLKGYFNINNWSMVHAGQRADQLLPHDALVIAPYNGDTAFLYQTKRSGWPAITTDLSKMISWGANYYVTTSYDRTTAEILANPKNEILDKNDEFLIVKLNP